MEIGMKKEIIVNAKELRIYTKVRDTFTASLYDAEGAELKGYEGYVPGFMPGEHYGDYIILNIDIDTGQITNWSEVTKKQIEKFINGDNDE